MSAVSQRDILLSFLRELRSGRKRDGRAVIAEARGGVVVALRKQSEKSADIAIPPGSGDLISAAAYGAQGFAFLTSTGKVLLYTETRRSGRFPLV